MSEPYVTFYHHSIPQMAIDKLIDQKEKYELENNKKHPFITDHFINNRRDDPVHREFEDALWTAPRKIFEAFLEDRMNTEKLCHDYAEGSLGSNIADTSENK